MRLLYFSANLLDPQSWVSKADDLLAAANLLRPTLEERWARTQQDPAWRFGGGDPPLGLNGVWLMLMAFAIENLSKALIVRSFSQSEKQEVQASGTLPERLHRHNLLSLARSAGVAVTPEEERQLQRLYEAAVSFGRYPLPTRSDQTVTGENAARREYDLNDVVEADLHMTCLLVARFREGLNAS